jgi:hypothetical protein
VITEEDFREFVFTNPVKLHAEVNPEFFKGTAIETAVGRLLAEGRGKPRTAIAA